MAANLRVTGNEKANERDAQRHECVNVKERHRRIKRELNPEGQGSSMSILRSEIFFAPMPEQNQSGRDRVKQAALGHEHRERNAFPRDVVHVLVIDEFEIFQELKTGKSAVEKKTGNRKAAAPAIKRKASCGRGEQADPNQTRNETDLRLEQQRVEEIDSGGITKMIAERVNWI